jgi:hypothetical protein
MKVQKHVVNLWDLVNTGVGDPHDDRRTLYAILSGVPMELMRTHCRRWHKSSSCPR